MPTPISRNPYIDHLLRNPDAQRAAAEGMPSYGIDAMMAFLKDIFLDPINSNGEFVTAPVDALDDKDPSKYMQVSDVFAWGDGVANPKPRIVVASRGSSDVPVGLGRGTDKFNLLTGESSHLFLGTHRLDLLVYSGDIGKARRVAEITKSAVRKFAPVLRELLYWVKIDAPAIGPATPVFPGGSVSRLELTMVPVTVTGMQSSRFTVIPESPRIGGIALTVEDAQTKTVKDEIGTGPQVPQE